MNNNSSQDLQASIAMKRRWQESRSLSPLSLPNFTPNNPNNMNMSMSMNMMMGLANNNPLAGFDHEADRLISGVIPPVTVVLEGRSICQRISLHKHANYQSLANALRQMFVDDGVVGNSDAELDLSNAVPGHLIAYEDMENDLLLVGDLNWKDFVRVAKRIRIVPVKANSRKGRSLN